MLFVKPNLNVLPKTTAVVIPCCLGIPKGLNIYRYISNTCFIIYNHHLFCCSIGSYLHDGVGCKNSLLNIGLT